MQAKPTATPFLSWGLGAGGPLLTRTLGQTVFPLGLPDPDNIQGFRYECHYSSESPIESVHIQVL